MWRGLPCVCSDLPVLREIADGGGCLVARVNDGADWAEKLRSVLVVDSVAAKLRLAARSRPLVRWADTAETILKTLG
jgi:glycosyltransferase involved in cell wall biosynthesis